MRICLILAAALLLAGCDRPTIISHVDKRGHMSLNALWAMRDGRGIPVEIHGRPFAGTDPAAIARAVRPPGSSAQEVAFYPVPPGAWQEANPWRLVLHFNPAGAPNGPADCRRREEAPTGAPMAGRFTVNATFCQGTEWQAHGYLQALAVEEGDLAAFSDMLRQLMLAIFHEDADR